MTRNGLYALIAVLAIVVIGVVGYMIYEQSQRPGLEIRVNSDGIQVQGNG